MNERWNWDDIRLFLSVARAGGLAGATATTRVSAPTLSRRMTALERALGVSLFVRRREGYGLTGKGEELLSIAEAIEQGALKIERWRTATEPHPVVKIAAGEWTSIFIAKHVEHLVSGTNNMRVEILTGTAPADLLRREANLGLRNSRPETPGLAGRRLLRIEFAIFGEKSFVQRHAAATSQGRFAECDWVLFCPPGPKPPSVLWLEQQLHREARLVCSSAKAVLESALAGVGLCLLPCFIGDAEPHLVRASGVLDALGHDQWLVSHDDDRHNKPIREFANHLAALMKEHKALFAGERPN